MVTEIESLVDVHDFTDLPAPSQLALNQIGRVRLKTARPLAFDSYADERATGSFVLVDEASHGTVAAGLIMEDPS